MEVIEVTEREIEIIEVIERGPQGPTGPTGPQGPAGAGGVTSVSGTAPIVSSGGTTPTISVTTGSTAGTVAAGDDSRITGAAQKSANLSDLASASTARTNLGLGSAATSASTDFAAASHNHAASAITSGVFDNARVNFASPSAIGGTSAAAGSFTTLSASTSLTLGTSGILSGGTNIIEQRNTTSGQTFRIYNTVSGAADANFERGFMRWSSNVLQIGTEAGGTGSNKSLEIRQSVSSNWGFSIFRDTTRILGSFDNDIFCDSATTFGWSSRLRLTATADGRLLMRDNAATGFDRLQFGGTTSSFPALKRSSTTLQVRLADDSAYSVLDAQLRAQGTAPATSGATGTAGDIRYDADYIYVCTAANTWKRSAIATW